MGDRPELTAAERGAVLDVVDRLSAVLVRMNSSGVYGLEVQRPDPPTPYELITRAIKGCLALVLHGDVDAAQWSMVESGLDAWEVLQRDQRAKEEADAAEAEDDDAP